MEEHERMRVKDEVREEIKQAVKEAMREIRAQQPAPKKKSTLQAIVDFLGGSSGDSGGKGSRCFNCHEQMVVTRSDGAKTSWLCPNCGREVVLDKEFGSVFVESPGALEKRAR